MSRNEKGMTLIEVLVGLALLMVVTVPLVNIYTKMANSSRIHDLRVSYAILRGETDILYKNHEIASSERNFNVDGVHYLVSTAIEKRDSTLVTWSMDVRKGKKNIAGVRGVLYAP